MDKEKIVVKIPSSGNKAVDVYTWLDNLNALGQVVTLIARHDVTYFKDVGEFLGGMISDYSNFVSDALLTNNPTLEDFFK